MSLGLPSGRPSVAASADWEGLLSDAAWLVNTMNPVSDINDAVTGSERFSDGVLTGDWRESVLGIADMAGGLLGIALPGHYSQYKDAVNEASDVGRRLIDGPGHRIEDVATDADPPAMSVGGGSPGGPRPAPAEWPGAPMGEPPGRPALSPEGVPLTATHVGGWYNFPRGQIDWLGKKFHPGGFFRVSRDDLLDYFRSQWGEPPPRLEGFSTPGRNGPPFATYAEGTSLHVPAHEGGHGIVREIFGENGLDDAAFAALPDDIRRGIETDLSVHSYLTRPSIRGTSEDNVEEWLIDGIASYQWRGPWFRDNFPAGAEAIRRLLNADPKVSRSIQFYSLPLLALLGLDMLPPIDEPSAPQPDDATQ